MEKSKNKTVIISGSSSGLGAFLAKSFSLQGFNVVINYSKKRNEAKALEKELSKTSNVKVIKGDVSKFSNVTNVVDQAIKQFGRVDILINNAGIHIDEKVLKMRTKSWQKVIDINLTGVFNFSKAVLPQMINQRFGRIINISSFAAFEGIPGASNYVASKAGVIGFTRSLAKEVAKYNITVNAISPGYFDIGMFFDLSPNVRKKILEEIPAKRLGKPKEISQLINVIILSDYLTGRIFVLDGGFSS